VRPVAENRLENAKYWRMKSRKICGKSKKMGYNERETHADKNSMPAQTPSKAVFLVQQVVEPDE